MTITLTHSRINTYHDLLLSHNFERFEDWMRAVEKESQRFDEKEIRDKFKGDMFEIFCQFFVKYFENILGVHNFKPNLDNDYGVDGDGAASRKEKPAALQFKYRSNPNEVLFYGKDLSTFFAQAPWKFKVTEPENMILISTTFKTDYKIAKVLGGQITHINKNAIEKLVNNKNSSFWKELEEAIKASYIIPEERPEAKPLWPHQKEALSEIDKFFRGNENNRGQIIIPTGGGKTRIEAEAINCSIDNGGIIHVIMAPRIALVNQILNDCWNRKEREWDKLLVRSGADERLKFYTDEEYGESEAIATTEIGEIYNKINESLKIKKPLLIFSTYHSADKIGEALKRLGEPANLSIGDEAHNMTTEGFNDLLDPDIIPTYKWLFFTATRRIKGRRGMDNVKRFGTIIYKIQPADLIKRGIIVPPRIHVMYYKGIHTQDGGEKAKYDVDFIKAAINKHLDEFKPDEFRLIIACKAVPYAHRIAEDLRRLPELKDFFIATVSSNQDLMKEEITILGIQNFSTARKEIFDRFKRNKFAILLHFNILSEGIDLPGTTAVMPLRDLQPISVVQFIGRALRLNKVDRLGLLRRTIRPGNPFGWEKPFGWVIFPDDKDGEFGKQAKEIITSIRRSEFNPDISYTVEKDDSIAKNIITDVEDLFPELPKEAKEFRTVLHNIDKEIEHEIEEEELALIKQDQTILEFAEWKGN